MRQTTSADARGQSMEAARATAAAADDAAAAGAELDGAGFGATLFDGDVGRSENDTAGPLDAEEELDAAVAAAAAGLPAALPVRDARGVGDVVFEPAAGAALDGVGTVVEERSSSVVGVGARATPPPREREVAIDRGGRDEEIAERRVHEVQIAQSPREGWINKSLTQRARTTTREGGEAEGGARGAAAASAEGGATSGWRGRARRGGASCNCRAEAGSEES